MKLGNLMQYPAKFQKNHLDPKNKLCLKIVLLHTVKIFTIEYLKTPIQNFIIVECPLRATTFINGV